MRDEEHSFEVAPGYRVCLEGARARRDVWLSVLFRSYLGSVTTSADDGPFVPRWRISTARRWSQISCASANRAGHARSGRYRVASVTGATLSSASPLPRLA
jgi:hypothetical protein